MAQHAPTTDAFDYFWENAPSDSTGIWAYLDARPLPPADVLDVGSQLPDRDAGYRFAHFDLDEVEVVRASVSHAPTDGSLIVGATKVA